MKKYLKQLFCFHPRQTCEEVEQAAYNRGMKEGFHLGEANGQASCGCDKCVTPPQQEE